MRESTHRICLAVAFLAAGCGASPTSADTTPMDAQTTDVSAAVEAPDAAGLCAVAAPSRAPVITDSYTAAAMPAQSTLTGGVIAPGTYFHVQQINYGAATGPAHTRQTMVVVDASGTTAILSGMIDTMPLVAAERLAVSGNMLTQRIACPSVLVGMVDTVGYSFSGGMLRLYAYDENTESDFQLQP